MVLLLAAGRANAQTAATLTVPEICANPGNMVITLPISLDNPTVVVRALNFTVQLTSPELTLTGVACTSRTLNYLCDAAQVGDNVNVIVVTTSATATVIGTSGPVVELTFSDTAPTCTLDQRIPLNLTTATVVDNSMPDPQPVPTTLVSGGFTCGCPTTTSTTLATTTTFTTVTTATSTSSSTSSTTSTSSTSSTSFVTTTSSSTSTSLSTTTSSTIASTTSTSTSSTTSTSQPGTSTTSTSLSSTSTSTSSSSTSSSTTTTSTSSTTSTSEPGSTTTSTSSTTSTSEPGSTTTSTSSTTSTSEPGSTTTSTSSTTSTSEPGSTSTTTSVTSTTSPTSTTSTTVVTSTTTTTIPTGAGCADVQARIQAEIGDGSQFETHGQLVSRVNALVRAEGEVFGSCRACIVRQFARRVPIAEQQPCGPSDSARAAFALGVDQPLSAVKLLLKSSDTAEKALFLSKDTAIQPPTLNGPTDPTLFGASVELCAQAGHAFFDLPAQFWHVNGSGTVFKFTRTGGGADVKVALVKGGRTLKVVSKAVGLPLGGVGPVGVRVSTGDVRYCALFTSESIVRDEPGKYIAQSALAGSLTDCSDVSLGCAGQP